MRRSLSDLCVHNRPETVLLAAMRILSTGICAALCAIASIAAEPVLNAERRAVLAEALAHLALAPDDLRFDRDLGRPLWAHPALRGFLNEPLSFIDAADRLIDSADGGLRGRIDRASAYLPGVGATERPAPAPASAPPRTRASERAECLAFLREAEEAMEQALCRLTQEERREAAVGFYSDLLRLGDFPDRRSYLEQMGFDSARIERAARPEYVLDPEPEARAVLDRMERMDFAALIRAAHALISAADALTPAVWTNGPAEALPPTEGVFIGTPGDDRYDRPARLIIDPGGSDEYAAPAVSADGVNGFPVCLTVDFGGHDRYVSERLLGPCSASLGAVMIRDYSGNDLYAANFSGVAAAFMGAAILEDRAGNDKYSANRFGQAAAEMGLALLFDEDGFDRYEVGYMGQGYAGPGGVGWLADRAGDDRYDAGGVHPDYERHDDRFLSMAQGFAIGLRPFIGGGFGALTDGDGHDRYVADIYGQGASYWYSAGLLADGGGHDDYTVFHYGQGSGIHMSCGLLYDEAGRDRYSGYILCQGNAHDYAVGWLVDGGGDDTYTADHHAQGRAINNSLAVLLDAGGRDAYFARREGQAQGIGNNGDLREYGSLALLLDLAGRDRYTEPVAENRITFRPFYGLALDREEAAP